MEWISGMNAAVDLADNDAKVIDVALKYGYDSPTAFNRAFQRVHQITPSAAKERGVKVKAFPPIAFHMMVKGVQELNYRIEKKNAIRVIGISTELSQDTAENFKLCPWFWAKASMEGIIAKLAEHMNTAPMGLMGISTCNDTEDWKYYIAVASDTDKGDFEEFIIPEATWAVFYGEGNISGMQELETRIVAEWLPTSGYEYANAPDVELYLSPGPEDAKYEVWIPIVKKS